MKLLKMCVCSSSLYMAGYAFGVVPELWSYTRYSLAARGLDPGLNLIISCVCATNATSGRTHVARVNPRKSSWFFSRGHWRLEELSYDR